MEPSDESRGVDKYRFIDVLYVREEKHSVDGLGGYCSGFKNY